MTPPLAHLITNLDTALPLCGEDALLATVCTLRPELVTCPRCRRASNNVDHPRKGSSWLQEGPYATQDVQTVSPDPDHGNLIGSRQKSMVSEQAFLSEVRRLAQGAGYLTYHTYRSDRSEPGWFDLACAKPGKPLILAELKAQRGKLTLAQRQWYDAVCEATGIVCQVWRPGDLAQIRALFRV